MAKLNEVGVWDQWNRIFPELTLELQKFVASGAQKRWIHVPDNDDPDVKVYVRRSLHSVHGQVVENTLDVSTVIFKHQGLGLFTKFLDWCEIVALQGKMSCVYVESVFDPRFAAFLVRRGYKLAQAPVGDCVMPNYVFTAEQIQVKRFHEQIRKELVAK